MKSDNKYRFTLSWGRNTEDQLLAGEFLESLGNRKSRFIISLVCKYLSSHPEMTEGGDVVKLVLESSSAGKMLEEKIREMVKQEMAGHTVIREEPAQTETVTVKIDSGVAEMAKNLEVWDM